MAQAENLDSRLLNREDEDGAAGELREKRRDPSASSGQDATEVGSGDETGVADKLGSLRQRVMAARQAINLKEQAKQKLKEIALAPAKMGTSRLLELAWLNLIDSFGLTLIWINIHVFLRLVVGEELFCKLGREWLPKQVTQAGGEATETAGKGIGLLEVIVLLILDFIVLAVIFVVLALIVMIVNFMGASWWGKLKIIWEAVMTLGWGAVNSLLKLF